MKSLFLLVFWTMSAWANSLAHFCGPLLSLTAGDSIPVEVVVDSYGKVLTELGDGRLTSEVIGKMLDSQDPFTVPPEAKMQSETLQDALRDFKTLLVEHGNGKRSFTKELLAYLSTRVGNQEKTEKKVQKALRKTAGKPSFTVDWPNHVHQVRMHKDWLVGTVTPDYKGNHVIYLQNLNGQKATLSFQSRNHAEVLAVHPTTGELWYSSYTIPLKVFKLPLFDGRGVPLTKSDPVPVELKGIPSDVGCRKLELSPDGSRLMIVTGENGVHLAPAAAGASLSKIPLDFVPDDSGFLGNRHLFVRHGYPNQGGKLTKVFQFEPSVQELLSSPINSGGAWMSPDSKNLFVLSVGFQAKPAAYHWRVGPTMLHGLGPWDLGHADRYTYTVPSYFDTLFPLQDNKVLHLVRKTESSQATHFRLMDLTDPEKPLELASSPISKEDGSIYEMKMSPDGRYLHANHASSGGNQTKSLVWEVNALTEE